MDDETRTLIDKLVHDEVIYKLKAILGQADKTRLFIMYGPSGAGKTSIIKNSLIPIWEDKKYLTLLVEKSAKSPSLDMSGSSRICPKPARVKSCAGCWGRFPIKKMSATSPRWPIPKLSRKSRSWCKVS